MTEPEADNLEEGAVVAGYVVEGVLGRGGHGVVYAAREPDTGAPVALKLLLGDGRDDAAARLRREARAVEALGGPHVPVPIAVETWKGRPLLVMERLWGRDLAQVVEDEAPLPAGEAMELVAQACEPLRRAHARGIVHRDIKPSNLFLHEGEPRRVCVLDFGIAKVLDPDVAVDASLTATGSFLGSPRYVAPEQIRDAKQVDPRCDVWALGVVLYELLSGEAPFRASTVHGLCAQIAADEPEPLGASVPPEVAELVMTCLAKDPAARPHDAGELLGRLEDYLGRPPRPTLEADLDETWDGDLGELPQGDAAAVRTVSMRKPSRGWLVAVLAAMVVAAVAVRTTRRSAEPAPAVARSVPPSAEPHPTASVERGPSRADAPSPSAAPPSETTATARAPLPVSSSSPAPPGAEVTSEPSFGDPLADRR